MTTLRNAIDGAERNASLIAHHLSPASPSKAGIERAKTALAHLKSWVIQIDLALNSSQHFHSHLETAFTKASTDPSHFEFDQLTDTVIYIKGSYDLTLLRNLLAVL